jgi:hypothetical protein
MKCIEIEESVSRLFGIRQNIIVPNISWGAGLHECDLLIINKSHYATEIEIKVSKADLKKDLLKEHGHKSDMIKELYYAMPSKLIEYAKTILPETVGLIGCELTEYNHNYHQVQGEGDLKYDTDIDVIASIERKAKSNGGRKLTEKEVLNIARLGTMRIWNLKKKLIKLTSKTI